MNLIAGLVTNCCMHLDSEGKVYCILASQMKNAGMLFIFKKNKPVANSFVTLLTMNPSGNKDRRALVINCIVFNKEISSDAISYALSKHFSDESFDIYYGLAYNYGISGILKSRYYTSAVAEKYVISEQFLEKDFIDLVRSYPPTNEDFQDPLQSVDFMIR